MIPAKREMPGRGVGSAWVQGPIQEMGAAIAPEDLIPDEALTSVADDLLRHAAIADRVAEIIRTVKTPANIALFGPWGSGKSSFGALLKAKLKSHNPTTHFVHYSTWRFKGEPLQRNFISFAATELGQKIKEGSPYHDGLYREIQTASFSGGGLKRSQWRLLAAVLLIALAAAALLFFLSTLLLAATTGKDVIETGKNLLPTLIVPSVLTSVLAMLATGWISSLSARVTHSAPTQEQLRDRFRDLVAHVGGEDPIVFYIDELDRCSASDVVETLGAIRNFFDVDNCVFVVAADRDALISALKALPQGTPVDEANPYRSTATEFLDKVFQYQLSLPPLRAQGIATFAQNLVEKRGGIWAELRAAGYLDRVVYVLIPSHIRSPRHVKVLLNNFAANARIASSRGISHIDRALEIAKLTVFQTEFPLFVPALFRDPHLPDKLLDRLSDIGKKQPPADLASRFLPGVEAADDEPVPPAITSTRDDSPLIKNAIYDEFRNYLSRVRQYPDPGRDLLYLEPAARTIQLDDLELGQMLEEQTVDDPAAVATACIDKLPADDRWKAISLLGQIASDVTPLERPNIVTAMLMIAESTEYRIGLAAEAAFGAIHQMEIEKTLDGTFFIRAFMLGVWNQNIAFANGILRKDGFLDDPDNLREMVMLSDRLPHGFQREIWEELSRQIEDPSLWEDALADLPFSTTMMMLQTIWTPEVQGEIAGWSPEEQSGFAEAMVSAVRRRTDPEDEITEFVLESILLATAQLTIYEVVRDELIEAQSPVARCRVALAAMRLAPPEDWEAWIGYTAGDYSDDKLGNKAVDALDHVFASLGEAAAEPSHVDVVKALVGIAVGESVTKDMVSRYVAGAAKPWASAEPGAKKMAYDCLLALRPLGTEVADQVAEAIGDDLIAGVSDASVISKAILIALGYLADLPVAALQDIGDKANTALASVPAPVRAARQLQPTLIVRLRVQAARTLVVVKHQKPDQALLPTLAEIQATLPGDPRILPLWLEACPPVEDVRAIAEGLAAAPIDGSEDAFRRWARVASIEDRSALLLKALDQPALRWLFGNVQGDEKRLVAKVAARVKKETTAPGRNRVSGLLGIVEPRTAARLEVVVDLIESELAIDTKQDVQTAVQLLRYIPDQAHDLDKRIAKAFVGHKLDDLTDRDRGNLRAHRVAVPGKTSGRGLFRLRK